MDEANPTVTYDPQLQIIFVDYSNLTITTEVLKYVLAQVRSICATLSEKVFVASCLANARVKPDRGEEFGQLTAELLGLVRGVIRYGVTDSFTNITIRTSTVNKRLQGIQSHIYPDRVTAIAAIRRLQK